MPRPRRHSNTPDQEAARIFEAKLKRHVQENPECQWEYDWFRGALKKSIRRSRVQIDAQVKSKAESGEPLCDRFMHELAQPFSYLDGAQSPRSSLFASHSPDARTLTSDSSPERDPPRGAPSVASDTSPERNTPFGRTSASPKFNPRAAIPGTPYDESAVSSVAPTPKVPGAFLASAHSLIPDSSVENSPTTRPDVIPAPASEPAVPEIILVPEPDMDTQTPRFELPSPFDNHGREIPRARTIVTPHTSSEAGDHPMFDRPDPAGDLPQAGDVPDAHGAGDPIAREAGDSPVAQEAGHGPIAQESGPIVQEAGSHPIDKNPPARESVPAAPRPFRLPGSYQASIHSLTPGVTPGASVDDLAAQLPTEVLPGNEATTPTVEKHPAALAVEIGVEPADTPKSGVGLELDLFPHPPALQVPALQVPALPPATHSAETTPRSPISPIVPGAYNHSLLDFASALPTRSIGGVSPNPGVESLLPVVGQAPSDLGTGQALADPGIEQALPEPVPAPVPGTEPAPRIDADQVPSTNVPAALDTSPAESALPTKDSPAPAPEPALRQAPTSTLQVHTEQDSLGLAPAPESAAPSPFALLPGLGDFDIRSRVVGAPVAEGNSKEPESGGNDGPLAPDVAPESNESTWDPPESPVVVDELDGAGETKSDDKPAEDVSPPVVLEPVVVPGDAPLEETAKTSAEVPLVGASSGIVTSPRVDVQTHGDDAATTEREVESAPAASEPVVQQVTAPVTLQPEHADKPQDEAQALPQAKLEDLPNQEPEVRPDLGAALESEDVPPQTQPKDEQVVPSSDPAPAVEQVPEPQQRHDNQSTEPTLVAPQAELEPYDASEPAPVEQESKDAETDVQGPALDEVSPGDVAIVAPSPENSPAVQEPVHQAEPTKEPEQASSEAEPLVKPEQPIPELDQAPSAEHPHIESQNIPVQQPEPQLDPLETQPVDEPLPSSERAPIPSQTVEPQLQETVDGSECDQPAGPGQDSAPKVPQSLPDPGEALPEVDSALDVADEVLTQGSTIVPPAPESTSIVQETIRQLEPAEEPEHIAPTVGPEPSLDAQPGQPAPVSVPSESLPPPPAVDSVDSGPSPGPQSTDATPVVYITPDEPQPSVVQAPVEVQPTRELPSSTPEVHPDLPSAIAGETQQVVAHRDESLTADLSPTGRPDTQPNVELPGPGPVTIEIPGERAPVVDLDVDDDPVFTPVSASTAEAESVRTPLDAIAPQPRAQSESPTPPNEPESQFDPTAAARATELSKEAGKLAQQFGAYGNIDDLDEAIEAYGQAAELLAPDSEVLDVSSYLNLGRMMRVKFEAFNNIEDLDSAFDDALLKAHDLLQSTPTNELYHDVLHELGVASLDRYLYDGSEVASDDARRYCELALNAESSPSGPKRAETHTVQSRLHLARFENLSGAEDAVSALESLDAASKADPALASQARYMEDRARALFACYQTRRPEYIGYLDEALDLARPARDLTPTVTIQHPVASTLLAELLLARYDRSHDQPDLDEALELLEDAVQEVPYVCPEQPSVGERLARALLARFANGRDIEDLDDAISFLEIALDLTVTNHHRRRSRLDAFGGALTLRFRYLALGEGLAEDNRRELMAGIGSM
ncbi:hypothetical protein FRC10_011344 [Ceratobasidium sp. 414]|nr:hypothetical protein FRC10_011344 [Ceratobasidium sp. 414]